MDWTASPEWQELGHTAQEVDVDLENSIGIHELWGTPFVDNRGDNNINSQGYANRKFCG